MTHQTVSTPFDKALFRGHCGLLRTSEALRLGIHPRTLYAMRDDGTRPPEPFQGGRYGRGLSRESRSRLPVSACSASCMLS
jgi:hypothetical protein